MILRDNLAVDRTELANERTFLAFVRTSLTMLIAGLSLLKFFNVYILHIIGWIFISFSVVIMCAGYIKRNKIAKRINQEIKDNQ